ncbi:type IV pilus modification protein PilV [Chitinolyticbacter albus]|uniref:type IV pilus modification protein PilV n=1 Tax=Chitinolyticbacter albus TaxID=2961951 RepID=UPI00210A7A58|nr:type IV pilus modification protein PilV [Chitinolyticbacter albus]
MIEVLVSLVILAIGILGLASLQLYSMKNSQNAYWRSIASDLANDLADRIRTNRSPKQTTIEGGVMKDEKSAIIPFPPDYARIACTANSSGVFTCNWISGYTAPANTAGTNLAMSDLANWMQLAASSLPVGSTGGAIVCRDNDLSNEPASSGPSLDPAAADFSTKTGCLAPTAAKFAEAPYVIKIWWQEQEVNATSDGKSTAVLQYFATPI